MKTMSYLSNDPAPKVTRADLWDWTRPTFHFNSGPSLPVSGNQEGDFFLCTGETPNRFYRYYLTPTPPHWESVSPVSPFQAPLVPTGESPLQIVDSEHPGSEASLFLVYVYENDPIFDGPLLMTDRGLIVKKDLMAGGFIDSGQGALWLNYGLYGKPDLSSPPVIQLMSSLIPYPSGTQFPDPSPDWYQDGQLFTLTTQYYWSHKSKTYPAGKYRWEGGQNGDWIKGNDYTGMYDTLYLCKSNLLEPAHLDLGNLTTHGPIQINNVPDSESYASYIQFVNPTDPYLAIEMWNYRSIWGKNTYDIEINTNYNGTYTPRLLIKGNAAQGSAGITSYERVTEPAFESSGGYNWQGNFAGTTANNGIFLNAVYNGGTSSPLISLFSSGFGDPNYAGAVKAYIVSFFSVAATSNPVSNLLYLNNSGNLTAAGWVHPSNSTWGMYAASDKLFLAKEGVLNAIAMDTSGHISTGTYGTPFNLANGGVGGQLQITNMNNGYNYNLTVGDSGLWGNTFNIVNGSNRLLWLDTQGTLGITSDLWATHHYFNGNSAYLVDVTGQRGSFTLNNAIGTSGDLNVNGNLWLAGAAVFNPNAGSNFTYLIWTNTDVLSLLCDNSTSGYNVSYPWNGHTYYLGAFDCGAVFTKYINPISSSEVIIGGNVMPSANNNANIGGNGTGPYYYWASVWANYLKYKNTPSSFDACDDLDLVRQMKTTQLNGEDVIDPQTITHLINGDGFYESSRMDGWHLSVQKRLLSEIDTLKTELNALRSEYESTHNGGD
jgi:hypothetical protein